MLLVIAVALGLALMVLPTTTALSARALAAVPVSQLRASLALGADRWQTFRRVALPTAWPGVIAGLTLGFGRAIGETMVLLMIWDPDGVTDQAGLLGAAETVVGLTDNLRPISGHRGLYAKPAMAAKLTNAA